MLLFTLALFHSCYVHMDQLHAVSLNISHVIEVGACSSIVVKALCYKPEGHWFDTR
jgi:hypothetical protein